MIKETFIIRTEWSEAITELDPTDQATIFRNLFAYHSDGEIVLDTFGVKIVWKLIVSTLERNIESYDKRRETSAENGKKGGRGNKATENTEINLNKPNLNLKNPQVYLDKPNNPIESLSDSVYVYDSVSVSVSESEGVLKNPLPPEKFKTYPELILLPPGHATDHSNDLFYETEISHRHGFDTATIRDIHTAWIGDRIGQMFTLKEARQNFASYCSKWAQNNRNRGRPSSNPIQQKPNITSSYLS